jgi:hypothetical protein
MKKKPIEYFFMITVVSKIPKGRKNMIFFRKSVIGKDSCLMSPFGRLNMVSARAYLLVGIKKGRDSLKMLFDLFPSPSLKGYNAKQPGVSAKPLIPLRLTSLL